MLQHSLSDKNSPIDFYGQVIDQQGNPIGGVTIKVYVRHWELTMDAMSRPIRMTKVTDANGRFDIHGPTGDGIDIELIEKARFDLEPSQRSFGPSGGRTEIPIMFRMWSANTHERLIVGEKSFHIIPDGRMNFLNLTNGTIAASGEGDFKIWVRRPAEISSGQRYEWSCGIEGNTGGLLLEVDANAAMYTAPAEGYEPSFIFEQKVGSGWGDSTGRKRFYVRLKNGKMYGRLCIELFAYYNDRTPGLVRVDYAVNPSGSPILR